MSSPDTRPPSVVPPAVSAPRAGESFRAKSIATRITETEFVEIESAASAQGKKVAEWLREAALAQARGRSAAETDPVLLAELMAVRDPACESVCFRVKRSAQRRVHPQDGCLCGFDQTSKS